MTKLSFCLSFRWLFENVCGHSFDLTTKFVLLLEMCYNVYLRVNHHHDIFGCLGSAASQCFQMGNLKIGSSYTVTMPQRLLYTKNC